MSEGNLDHRSRVLAGFYRAFANRDWDAIPGFFAEDSEFGISGRSPLAGVVKGPAAVVDVLRRLVDDTEGTIGPVREDTWDICTSEHHAIFVEWLQATRGGKQARFYIHFVCAFEGDKIKRAFASFDSQYDFDELWQSD